MNGQCNCGAVSFEVLGSIHRLYQCHCSLCQKQSGSTSNTATLIPVQRFNWLSGEDMISRWQKDSGFSSHFCSQCGSPVPNLVSSLKMLWIPMGLINGEQAGLENAKVVMHLFTGSKSHWDELSAGKVEYSAMPENLKAFVEDLQ